MISYYRSCYIETGIHNLMLKSESRASGMAGATSFGFRAGAMKRRYDKGERRHKHDWSKPYAGFQTDNGNPKKVIGKCPQGVDVSDRDRLLQIAVPLENGDRDLPVPKAVFAVYQGAIFVARTSDFGTTYHGYPFQGKLPKAMLEALRCMADKEGCRDGLEKWIKTYITVHGRAI